MGSADCEATIGVPTSTLGTARPRAGAVSLAVAAGIRTAGLRVALALLPLSQEPQPMAASGRATRRSSARQGLAEREISIAKRPSGFR
jgi:hypothetical protein